VARYYFNVYDDVVAIDPEGLELPNAHAARLNALHGARELIAEQVRHGYITLSHWIDVVDEKGEAVLTLPFRDAVTVRE
jgi:hypothetical protein